MRKDASTWSDQWYKWPTDVDEIVREAHSNAGEYNVYFSSYLYRAQRRTKENVLPSKTIQADLDGADVRTLPLAPSVLVQTSVGRTQGFWLLSEELDPETHEALSRKLAYAIEGCDHAGWPIGKTARMPETTNHKYLDGPQDVIVANMPATVYDASQFDMLPDVELPSSRADEEWVTAHKQEPESGPNEILEQLRLAKKLTAKIVIQYNTIQADRSAALWALMLALFRAELNRDTVYHISRLSANNKFTGLRYNGDVELAKDVIRAEAMVQRKFHDPRSEVREIRMLPGPKFLLNLRIEKVVFDTLKAEGDFVHTTDNGSWYVPRATGRPIELTKHSEYFNALLGVKFGLNSSEDSERYVANGLINHTIQLPPDTDIGAMSHYNAKTSTLMIHSGGRDVLHISPTGIARMPNGANNTLFMWDQMSEPFTFDDRTLPDGRTWYDVLFENCFYPVVDMKPEVALALMRVWTLFIVFRRAAFTRPILAFIGEPGAGKSTTMRRLYRLFYGKRRDLVQATSENNLNLSSTSCPFLVIDNLDTWQKWLPDWLATAIADTDVEVRKLYTDNDKFRIKRQAVIGLTAHNPKFGRPDVADRLLLVTFRRLSAHHDESRILDRISQYRNRIWGGIMADVAKVLIEPEVLDGEAPKLRIADFAVVGMRIAKALGIASDFTEAVRSIADEQRFFTLEEEAVLVTALRNMAASDQKHDREGILRPATVLATELEAMSGDPTTFRRYYSSPVALSRKIASMQTALGEVFQIASSFDAKRGAKVWAIQFKPPNNGVHSNGTA